MNLHFLPQHSASRKENCEKEDWTWKDRVSEHVKSKQDMIESYQPNQIVGAVETIKEMCHELASMRYLCEQICAADGDVESWLGEKV